VSDDTPTPEELEKVRDQNARIRRLFKLDEQPVMYPDSDGDPDWPKRNDNVYRTTDQS
jgi:hypothetical protein